MPELVSLLPLLAIFAIFWLLVIRPASKRNKEMAQLQASIAVGDQVMTTAGIFGTVRTLTDDRVGLEIAPGVTIEIVRGAIGSKTKPATPEQAATEEQH